MVFLMLCAVLCWWGAASEPVAQWSYGGLDGVSVSPCVADVVEAPGLETIAAGGDTGVVQCLGATGAAVWESKTPLAGRIVTPPAVSGILPAGKRAVAVASEGGLVSCIDATSGVELWRHDAGAPCTGLAWSDLNGDKGDELVVFTRTKGILALSPSHTEVWAFSEEELGRPLTLAGPGAIFDVDEDQWMEVFAADAQEAFCVDSKGGLRWKTKSEIPLTGSLAVAGPDQEGIPKLYCAGKGALLAIDAGIGDVLWQCPLDALGSEAFPYIVLGDLDRDNAPDIVVGVPGAGMMAVGSDGKVLWTYKGEGGITSSPILADVDADTTVEVVAGCAGNRIAVISNAGEIKASWQVQSVVQHAPLVADIKGDGHASLLYVDTEIRCATLGSAYVKPFMPWPMEGASMSGIHAIRILSESESSIIEDTRALLDGGSFEEQDGALPKGWTLEQADTSVCTLDTQTKLAGTSSVSIKPVTDSVVLVSTLIPIPSELNAISASVMSTGAGAAGATIRWMGKQGLLREDTLQERPDTGTGWKRFILNSTRTPLGAHHVCFALISKDGGGEGAHWDEAQITGTFRLIPQVFVAVNQIGYELNGPKQFTAWSNFKAASVKFELTSGEKTYKGILTGGTRIVGAYASDWGYYYWRGDFSNFDETGACTIKVIMDTVTAQSVPFAVESDLLWTATLPLALTCFKYHRCGENVPGGHLACHLDDALEGQSLTGGWHDGVEYSKRHMAAYVLELATAFNIVRHKLGIQFITPLGKDFLGEVCWGADLVLRSIKQDGSAYPDLVSAPGYWGPPEKETDNQPDTGDERKPDPNGTGDSSVHAAALARVARVALGNPAYAEAAGRALQWAIGQNLRGPMQFAAATDLYLATQQDMYAQLAPTLIPVPDPAYSENIQDYDAEFEPIEPPSFKLAVMLREQAGVLLTQADNPFGVFMPPREGRVNLFDTPADASGARIGNTKKVLEAAVLVAQAYRFNPLPEYKQFIINQFNWILGNNPESISLMEGAGKTFLPSYYHPYETAGLARGAVPGGIANGFTGQGPGDDRPFVDMSGAEKPDAVTNGIDLGNTLLYIKALCHLKRNIALEQ